MLDSGIATLSEKHRITLTLSLALLIHTLVVSVFPYKQPEIEHHPQTINVELVQVGSQPSSDSSPAQSAAKPFATPFSAEEFREDNQAETKTRPTRVTSQKSPRVIPEPPATPIIEETVAETQPSESQPQPVATSAPSRSSTASVAGTTTPEPREDVEQSDTTKESSKKSEKSSYITTLAAHIEKSGQIDRTFKEEGGQILTTEVELKLMSNGTLVDAKITKSSSYEELDREVYTAALRASPYPEPPKDSSRPQRFRVEIIFAPDRF